MGRLERTYNRFLNRTFKIMNPIKKSVMNTHCRIHKSINFHALDILSENDSLINEYNFLSEYIILINDGAVWADHDFKSSSHFYNPYKKKGLYGRKNALDLATNYYEKAIDYWDQNDKDQSLFYFGAAIHLIQDMTIPHHANIRLLDHHRQYETYIKKTYKYVKDYDLNRKIYLLNSIEDYIVFNARVSLRIYKKFEDINEERSKFYKMSRCSLSLANSTTAGAMILFYKDISSTK